MPDEDILIKGDAYRLRQVVLNLLSNAIKFTEQGSITCTLTFEQQTDSHLYFQIQVVDTGIGMTEQEQQQLFKRFSQVNSSIATLYGGTGLGLFVSKSLVELMKGEIVVASEKGKGTTFTCLIRGKLLTEQEKQHYLEESKTPITPPTPRTEIPAQTILVVEDNVINQKILQRLLEAQGHVCRVANNGLEALKLVFPNKQPDKNPFDLIFMDIKMPVMDGLSATKAIRKLEYEHRVKSVPIIGLSGNIQESDKELALKAGMDDYLAKPIQKKEVMEQVAHYAVKRRLSPTHYYRRNIARTGSQEKTFDYLQFKL